MTVAAATWLAILSPISPRAAASLHVDDEVEARERGPPAATAG